MVQLLPPPAFATAPTKPSTVSSASSTCLRSITSACRYADVTPAADSLPLHVLGLEVDCEGLEIGTDGAQRLPDAHESTALGFLRH
jgi:hypothetical protein